ncbi:hypothetical protein SAMN00017477_0474 [Peptoniphilus asaccharolyticus DSM 20463]|uniref:Flavoprotein, HI0933 family n=1 Tax=Peptoniphilus asaccharolyticus DSM 20463 TaxID=573058 RepID=A0A1W1UN82_PEPAS|nr:NAD(P)/FAD-dependent oxidoreductase [Peptoniphilus asaccharolyticus]MBL7574952.1 NAD(P)/FAD-dependent oxidoreductase [Peptoniphilus asaccharolyticus]SMB82552.1 hypothetical protein SAMN00017477_0474 [Peptoniphilus asaccharolyticus DSM 20463]
MRVAVIGAGAAGMMAAAVCKAEVILFEKNEKLGKKLFITGKGRCNLTNARDISEYFDSINRNPKFLYSALYTFTNENVMEKFESYGLKLKIERGDRVFPSSDKSSDVIKTYEKMLRDNNVEIRLNTEVRKITKVDDQFDIDGELFDRVIIACGGISYKSTGSTGDGYKFAQKFGHKIVELKPALSPILLNMDCTDLAGLSLKNVELNAFSGKKKISSEFGEMLFTHNGVSGPIVLRTSSLINRKENIKLFLDLKPALDRQTLDKRILRDFEEFKNKDISNALKNLLPKKMIDIVLKSANIKIYKKVNEISKEDRANLVESIKNLNLKYKSIMDINTSIVTSGGVDTSEIDSSTMESKLVKGLYFAGETIDIDAMTGGYNLQLANSTGYLAGINSSKIEND